MGWVRRMLLISSLAGAALACSLPGSNAAEPTSEPATTLAPSPLPPTSTPPGPVEQLWTCSGCGGESVWAFGEGDPRRVTVPAMYSFYSYSQASNEILFARNAPTQGYGPSHISATDLSVTDAGTGESHILLAEGVVEAAFAPNGLDIGYILATAATYELHWLAADGSDRVLARDVTFSWSIAPSGAAVAFTRESRYDLPIDPGVYVVSVESALEIKVSDVDNAGFGGTADAPVWSPDSRELLIAHWAGPDAARLVLAQADGSGAVDVTIDPVYADEWWATVAIPALLWAPDGEHLVGSPSASAEAYGPSPILYYRLDRASSSLRDIVLLADGGAPAVWDVPGRSVWILDSDGNPQRLALP